MTERHDAEAARLRAIKERLTLLQRADRAGEPALTPDPANEPAVDAIVVASPERRAATSAVWST